MTPRWGDGELLSGAFDGSPDAMTAALHSVAQLWQRDIALTIAEFDLKNFWELNIGHVLTLIALLFTCLTFAFKFSKRIDGLEGATTEALKSVRELTVQLREIDQKGTQASQRALVAETELTKSNTRRLDNLDKIITTVAEMGRDLHWIKEALYPVRQTDSLKHGRE